MVILALLFYRRIARVPQPDNAGLPHTLSRHNLDSLRRAAALDGVIHLAFKYDLTLSGGFQNTADTDRYTAETFSAGPTAGPPYTGSIPHTSPAWRRTRSPTRARHPTSLWNGSLLILGYRLERPQKEII